MQNIDVRFNATSNFTKVKADIASVEAEAQSLGKTLQSRAFAQAPKVVDPGRWREASSAVTRTEAAFRAAASSTGLLSAQQIVATSEAEKFTKALQKQDLSWSQMRKNSGIMKQVYQDQLRYQRMTAQYWGTDTMGRAVSTITIPKNVPAELDTMAQKAHFFGMQMQSAGKQTVNLGKNLQWSGRQLTVGLTYPMALFGAAAGVMAYKVDNAFGSINKVYDYSAKALQDQNVLIKEQGMVREQSMAMATKVAKEYGLTITKTLEVEQELAATGLKGNKLFSTTEQVQRFSALGDIDPKQTTAMVISLQNAFKKETGTAKGLTDTLNYMNAASNATSLSLQDIAESTPRAAAAMAQMGVSAKDMTVLLVSMREAGVNAAEGANALKSASARILNTTITDKATKIFKSFGAGIDVGKISNQSKGNFLDFIKLLGQAEAANTKLTDKQKATANAALFGTYQFSRLSAALKNINDAYNGVNNQTKKAIDLTHASSEELAHQAQVAQNAMMSTPAAKLRKAWATLQPQLVSVGEVFLKVAAGAAIAGTKMLAVFNALPKGVKVAAAIALGVAAIAGPLIMLTGLFLNLKGQAMSGLGKVIEKLATLAGAQRLVTKEEQSATLTAEAQNKAMMETSRSVSTLAEEVAALAAAYGAANQEAARLMMTQAEAEAELASSNGVMNNPTPLIMGKGLPSSGVRLNEAEAKAFYATAQRGENGLFKSNKERLAEARAILATEEATTLATVKQEQNLGGVLKHLTGGKVAAGLMAASMITMVSSSNKVTDSIAKWAMIGSLVLPMTGKMIPNMLLTAKAVGSATARSIALGAGMRGAATAAAGAATSMEAMSGPIGWTLLAVTAIGVGIWKWVSAEKAHNAELLRARQEQAAQDAARLKAQAAVLDVTRQWADETGRGYKNFIKFTALANGSTLLGANPTQFQNSVNRYKNMQTTYHDKTTDKDYSNLTAASYKDMGINTQTFTLLNQYIQLTRNVGMSSKQAQAQMKAFLVAAGYTVDNAGTEISKALANTHLAAKGVQGLQAVLQSSLAALAENKGSSDVTNAISAGLTNYIGSIWGTAGPKIRKQIVDTLNSNIKGAYSDVFKNIQSQLPAGESIQDLVTGSFSKSDTVNQNDVTSITQMLTNISALRTALGDGSLQKQIDNITGRLSHNKDVDNAYGGNSLQQAQALLNLLKQVQASGDVLKGQEASIYGPLGTLIGISANNMDEFNNSIQSTLQMADAKTRNNMFVKFMNDIKSGKTHKTGGLAAMMEGVQFDPNKFRIPKSAQNDLVALLNSGVHVSSEMRKIIRLIAQANGLDFNSLIRSANQADSSTNKLKNSLDALPTTKNITINFRGQQATDIVKTAMQNVQSAMADSAMSKFNSDWDSRMAGVQAQQQAAQTALQNHQQDAMDAFDARWQKRKDAVTAAYQKRIDAIQKEIKAEQDADTRRQQIFEKEKARMQALADMQNKNIDYNSAINQGNLDEAAKVINNAVAATASTQMDNEEKAAADAMQKRIDALNKKNDQLEKRRDKELKQLEKMEARLRKHLERVQQMRANALQQHQQAVMNSLQKERDMDEATLNARLDLFRAYTATNQKDLTAWIHKLGLTYDTFGRNITQKGQSWADSFQTSLTAGIVQAGVQAASDQKWEQIGKSMGQALVKGLGFKNLTEFNALIRNSMRPSGGNGNKTATHHGGGEVGGKGTGRAGIPESWPLHRSEQMIRAQKGEFVINRRDSQRNLALLKHINNGGKLNSPLMGVAKITPYEGLGGRAPLMGDPTPQVPMINAPMAYAAIGMERVLARVAGKAKHAADRAAAQAAATAASGGPGAPLHSVTPPPGTDPRGVAAIRWASAMSGPGHGDWYNKCLSFVRQSFGAPGINQGANDSWAQAKYRYSIGSYSSVPAGVPVWWKSGSNGHVILSTGGGRAIGTDNTVKGQAWPTTIASVASWKGGRPDGWSADINGMQIYPHLRRGGTIRYDNTIANLHKGETVLTARLTKKFQENVASGGGDHYDISIDMRGAVIREELDIKKAVNAAIDEREAKVGRKRVIK